MAITIAQVSTPNSQVTEGTFLHYKARMVDVTADTSYPTGGYQLTAAALGWTNIVGAIPLGLNANAGRTNHAPIHVFTNAAQTALSIQYVNENDAAAYAQRPKLVEAQNASSQSGFSCRLIVLGY